MAVKIRLTRKGKKGKPFYRIVATDERNPRDGRYLEVLGTYAPTVEPAQISVKKERVDYWRSNGAQVSQTVSEILKRQQGSKA